MSAPFASFVSVLVYHAQHKAASANVAATVTSTLLHLLWDFQLGTVYTFRLQPMELSSWLVCKEARAFGTLPNQPCSTTVKQRDPS